MEAPGVNVKASPTGRHRGPAGIRNFYPVDTKGMCLICLRAIQRKKKYSKQVSSDFCKILMRYLKLDFHRSIVKPSAFKWKANKVKKVGIELCQDCVILASSFKDIYCQLELIQMRLHAYLKTISDIMRTAGRIPSRVKAYQERLGIVPKEQAGNLTGGSKLIVVQNLLFPKSALLAQNFRKELIQKTLECHKSALPRVKLHNNTTFLSPSFSKELLSKSTAPRSKSTKSTALAILTAPLSPIQTQFRNFLLAYSLSFSMIWLLATLTASNVPGSIVVPLVPSNANKTLALGVIEDIPVSETSTCPPTKQKPENSISANDKQPSDAVESLGKENRRSSILITDSGKTVLLPHQFFKTDEDFVDESIMEYEDNADLIDLSDDEFFAQPKSFSESMNMNIDVIPSNPNLACPDVVKQEPQELVVEVNERTCTECRIQLSCRAELEKHRSLIHKMLNHVQCPVCKNMFSSYHFLKNHRRESEACALDEATEALEFTTIAKPLFPYSNAVRGNRFCPMEGCFEVFLGNENLQLHLKTHGLFSCSQGKCKEKFDKARDLALHECRQHSGGQFTGYKCTRCNFHVGGEYMYVQHFLAEHLNINVFSDQCKICRKGFISSKRNQLAKEIHFRTHHDIQGIDPKSIVKCDIDNCEAFFLNKQQLKSHKTHIHHVEQEAKLNCSVCGEKMLNQAVLLKHKLQAHSNLPAHEIDAKIKRKQGTRRGKYKCLYCGNQYTSKYSLLIHSKVHDHLKESALKEGDDNEEEKSHSDNAMQVDEQQQTTKVTPENAESGGDETREIVQQAPI